MHIVFFFQIGPQILNDGHFKILSKECIMGEVKVLFQNFLFHRFISQLLLKLAF